jgi:hypothetical protein
MCHYCGCWANAAHRDCVAEQERASDLGDQAIRAIDQGDLGATRKCIEVMGGRSHDPGLSDGWVRSRAETTPQPAGSAAHLLGWRAAARRA